MKLSQRRFATTGVLAASAVLLGAGSASAHVSVNPEEAEAGGYSTVTFKVPNERDDASTVKLEVNLPADTPLASVMPQPVPGWDVKVTKSKLDKPMEMHGETINEAVSKVTWSGGKIEPGQFQQFPLSMGALPEDAEQMVFKSLQTYDSKEVVRWIEEPKEGEKEPEHPAPVLKLAAPAPEDGDGTDVSADGAKNGAEKGAEDGEGTDDAASDSSDGTDTTARVLGGVGIAVGVAGVAFGVLAGRRRSA
ncbi:YcnI family protein [Streptomyces sp. N2-109]|uniref:YcnI family protein n=1 Tax=Streptomyces gossypii TaxID=2883101 RepID=A0ABT2JND9_9ACTN|nr:YcnI family protein [Streptomyces gossypii]MCT2589336.1 YcnI family protein [Streptomyces gossypii]